MSSSALAPDQHVVTEVWREVADFPSYEVSCFGRIRSRRTGRMLVPDELEGGYLRVAFGRRARRLVHVVVLEAFAGRRPPGMHARHIHDPTPSNCTLWNLGWGTPLQNAADRQAHGTTGRADLAGRTFGHRRVVRRDDEGTRSRWICECACGATHSIRGDALLRGLSSRCPKMPRQA